MALDMTSFANALKQHYTDDAVEQIVYMDNPLLALMPKDEDGKGLNIPLPVLYGNPNGRSAVFATAQAASVGTSSALAQFLLTRVKDYSIATIANEALLASEGNANAFMEAATTEIDGAINILKRSLAMKMYRSGWGDVGQVGLVGTGAATWTPNIQGATVLTPTTSQIALLNANDVVNYEIGMVLNFSASQSANNLRNTGGTTGLTISGIDRTNGILTFTTTVATVTGTAANDYIFIAGDRQDSATPSRLCIAGLEGWLPAVAPTSGDSFFGQDRSKDATRLGGVRLNGAGGNPEEVLIEGAARVGREGFALSHYFVSFDYFSRLEKTLGSKVQYLELKLGEIGFPAIQINGPRGSIKVVPDLNCPTNRVFGLTLKYWKLYSVGKAPRVLDTDGLDMLRQTSADGVEVRYGYYAQMGCRAPGANINIQV